MLKNIKKMVSEIAPLSFFWKVTIAKEATGASNQEAKTARQ